MSAKFAMSLATGQRVAQVVIDSLSGVVTRAEVAGSTRRGISTVNDIDIVVCPNMESDMNNGRVAWHPAFLLRMASGGCPPSPSPRWTVTNKTAHGQTRQFKCKGVKSPDLSIEVFCATLDRFGWIWMLRTGPEDFTTSLVSVVRTRGPGFQFDGGAMWRRPSRTSTSQELIRVHTPDESDVFAALQIPFMPPDGRTDIALRRALAMHPWSE